MKNKYSPSQNANTTDPKYNMPFPALDEKRRWFCAGFLYSNSRQPKADLLNFARILGLSVIEVIQVESTLGYTLDRATKAYKNLNLNKPKIVIARG